MFIVWDRMFGTYVPEVVRQDVYGLSPQPNTFDPIQVCVVWPEGGHPSLPPHHHHHRRRRRPAAAAATATTAAAAAATTTKHQHRRRRRRRRQTASR